MGVCGSVYYRIIYFDYIFYNNPDFFRIVVDYYTDLINFYKQV